MTFTGKMLLVASLAIAMFAVGGIGVFIVDGGDSSAPGPSSVTVHGASGVSVRDAASDASSLEQGIELLQERLKTSPGDAATYAELGSAYVQAGRVTADPAYYPKAEGALKRSLALQPADENFQADAGMGALLLARHDFSTALEWGEKARAINPYNANVRGVIGDALIELGRYPEAFRDLQAMINLRPNVASYARASYARELQGDTGAATRDMMLAFRSSGSAEDRAWAAYQLGELSWNSGHVDAAADWYRQAEHLNPAYIPPHAGLAKVAWARGDTASAIEAFAWVTQRYPSPEYVIALGDMYASHGDREAAAQQYALVRTEEDLFRANGVNVDLELALFDADHGKPREALATARGEWDRRHSIHVADALGWALYRNGRYAEAAGYARQALHLGTRSALFLYHAGMIQSKLGNTAAAADLLRRALAANPNFSILYSGDAAAALARLDPKAAA